MGLMIAMPGAEPREDGAWPELPAFTRLLAGARRLSVAADWRAQVFAAAQGEPAGQPAGLAACAVPGLSPGAALCFATPLHAVVGISRVHLPPEGVLRLGEAEREAWRESFNREFGGNDLWLHSATGDWVLAASFADAARDPAPQLLFREPLARQPAASPSARALRRLGAEVELWLATHPLNREREGRPAPPLNNLWFWGGARTVADWQQARRAGARRILLASSPADLLRQYWQGLEEDWFAPALRALEAGTLDALRLHIGDNAWQLPDPSPLRWLRRLQRPQPWWKAIAA